MRRYSSVKKARVANYPTRRNDVKRECGTVEKVVNAVVVEKAIQCFVSNTAKFANTV
jgi:hypothetical protein